MAKESPYLKLEKRIAADERGGIMDRWRYGRELIKERKGFSKLPKGRLSELIVEAIRADLKVTEREIQYRIRCATIYDSEAKIRTACSEFGSWSALREAGFPVVEIDEEDPADEMEEVGIAAPAFVEDPLFEIPGFKPVLKINGRKVDLVSATVGQAVAYQKMCHDMHEGFGRTVAQIDETVKAMLRGSDGDLNANAVEAFKRGQAES